LFNFTSATGLEAEVDAQQTPQNNNLRQAQLASALIHFLLLQFIASLKYINPSEAIIILVRTIC
jgi:hypothetical protein